MADTVTFKGPWWRALLPEGPQKWLRNTVHTRHQGVAPPCQPHHTPPTHMLARYGCTAKPRRGVASWGWHLAGGGGGCQGCCNHYHNHDHNYKHGLCSNTEQLCTPQSTTPRQRCTIGT